jgi:hypothetical protein
MNQALFNGKRGAFDAKTGMDIAFGAIFILGIGLTVVSDTTSSANLTGLTATVVGYAPLIVGAVFLYGVARMGGVL